MCTPPSASPPKRATRGMECNSFDCNKCLKAMPPHHSQPASISIAYHATLPIPHSQLVRPCQARPDHIYSTFVSLWLAGYPPKVVFGVEKCSQISLSNPPLPSPPFLKRCNTRLVFVSFSYEITRAPRFLLFFVSFLENFSSFIGHA